MSDLIFLSYSEGAEDIELEPFENILLSRQHEKVPSVSSYLEESRDITVKESNVEDIYQFGDKMIRFVNFILHRGMNIHNYRYKVIPFPCKLHSCSIVSQI